MPNPFLLRVGDCSSHLKFGRWYELAEVDSIRTRAGLYAFLHRHTWRFMDIGASVREAKNAIKGRLKHKIAKITSQPFLRPQDYVFTYLDFPDPVRFEALGIEGMLIAFYQPPWSRSGIGSNQPGGRRNPIPSKFSQLTV